MLSDMRKHVSQVLYGNEVTHVPQRKPVPSMLSKHPVEFDSNINVEQPKVKSLKLSQSPHFSSQSEIHINRDLQSTTISLRIRKLVQLMSTPS